MRGFIGLLFYSVLALGPILTGVFFATRFLHRERFIGFATVAVVVGFLAGGVVGWSFVLPAQWTASFWTTVDAAGDSVKYGESFEHTAERALMYFLYSALLGAIAFAVAALVVMWRVPDRTVSIAKQ